MQLSLASTAIPVWGSAEIVSSFCWELLSSATLAAAETVESPAPVHTGQTSSCRVKRCPGDVQPCKQHDDGKRAGAQLAQTGG